MRSLVAVVFALVLMGACSSSDPASLEAGVERSTSPDSDGTGGAEPESDESESDESEDSASELDSSRCDAMTELLIGDDSQAHTADYEQLMNRFIDALSRIDADAGDALFEAWNDGAPSPPGIIDAYALGDVVSMERCDYPAMSASDVMAAETRMGGCVADLSLGPDAPCTPEPPSAPTELPCFSPVDVASDALPGYRAVLCDTGEDATWDHATGEWVPSSEITVGEVEFTEVGSAIG